MDWNYAMAHLYPISLLLENKNCLIVGGGAVAERKAATLSQYAANIRVVSPEATDKIKEWARQESLVWIRDAFQVDYLQDTFLVFIATDNQEINQFVAQLCREQGILVNAVDDPPNCDFFVPSVLRRGSLSIAISTEGRSPLLAARLRRDLEKTIPSEYAEWVDLLGVFRDKLKISVPDIELRKKILTAVINSETLELFIKEGREKAEERMESCMSSLRE